MEEGGNILYSLPLSSKNGGPVGLLNALPVFARLNKLVRANILSPSGDMKELLKEIRKEPTKEDISSVKDANLITSERSPGRHMPVLDLDFDAKLIPSSTEGHWHLYLDREMPWGTYLDLLKALTKAGIIQDGFLAGAIERGYSSVRLPHISKDSVEDNVIDPVAFKKKQDAHKQNAHLGQIADQLNMLGGTNKWTAVALKDFMAKMAEMPEPSSEYKPTLQSEYEKVDTKS